MLKILLFGGLLLSVSLPTLAQSAPAPLAQPGRFCVVSSIGNINDGRQGFTLDYGVPSKTNKLPDEQAYAERFKTEALRSPADMLNYMDSSGWELVQTTAVSGSSLVSYQYIFRRKAGQ
ncbi:MAG: hypothetical protein ACRYFZ_07220 [Janthinobacterium lividum]